MSLESIFWLLQATLVVYGAKAFYDNVVNYHLGITGFWKKEKEYLSWARYVFGNHVFSVSPNRKSIILYSDIIEIYSPDELRSAAAKFADLHHHGEEHHIVGADGYIYILFGSDLVVFESEDSNDNTKTTGGDNH